MKWRKIDKSKSERPTNGTYKDWKSLLAAEGLHRCVYCAIHDNRWGGERIFHVEHYKPKSKFIDLTNDYDNLFYACPICNGFKRDSWFEAVSGDWNVCHYPNPSEYDYSDFFVVETSKELKGQNVVGRFLIERLHLNRRHLILERRKEVVEDKLESLLLEIKEIFDQLDQQEISEIAKLQTNIIINKSAERRSPLYEANDLR